MVSRSDENLPVLIVGQGRSGTTLLAAILNRHPQLATVPETYFWRDLADYEGGWGHIVSAWPQSGIDFFESMDRWDEFGISAQETVDRMSVAPAGPRELFCGMCDQIAAVANKPRVFEKTPSHIRYIDPIREAMPTAKIIHIIRDGRAVSLSRQRLYWMSDSFTKNMYEWKQTVSTGRRRLADDPHAMPVRYEDLVTNEEATMKTLCEFIGVPFQPSILTPDGSEQKILEHNADWKKGVAGKISQSRAEAWKQELPAPMHPVSWAIAGDELSRWGYKGELNTGTDPRQVYLSATMETDEQGLCLDVLLPQIIDRGLPLAGTINILKDPLPAPPPAPEGSAIIFLTGSPLTWGWTGRSRWQLVKYFYRLKRKLRQARKQNIQLVWVYPRASAQPPRWRLLDKVEQAFARYANHIIYREERPAVVEQLQLEKKAQKVTEVTAEDVASVVVSGD